jgi:hypothetical protein
MNIAVIYLSWIPYGSKYLNDFLENYINMPAGYPHKLVIILNGTKFCSKEEVTLFKQIISSKGIELCHLLEFESGQDIEVYQKAANQIEADHLLFLNTYSQIKTAGWLLFYTKNWQAKVGLIGATASYASYLSAIREKLLFDWKRKIGFTGKMNSLKYYLKIKFLHGSKFKKFPAPHIRTTGFFISKNLFCSLSSMVVSNKMNAYFFENGKNSMTEQVLKQGYDCLIIDNKGTSYSIEEWPLSKTFWIAEQENLLIADNQTRKYDIADPNEKALLQKIAWNIKSPQ